MPSNNHSLQSMTVWNKVFPDSANNNVRISKEDGHTLVGPRCRPIISSAQYPENPTLSAMSISPCPSASTSKSLYQDQLQYKPQSYGPIILADGSKVYMNNEKTTVDVVSKVSSIRTPASSPLLAPLDHGDFINGRDVNQLNHARRNLQDCPGFGMSSTSVFQNPSLVPLPSSPPRCTGPNENVNSRKVAFKRPRKCVTKRPPNNCKGMVGKREEPKPSNAKSNINSAIAMSVVPSLTLIDKSQSPPRIFDRGELLGTGGFAKVYKVVERKSNKSFADKVINKEIFIKRSNARYKVDREIQLHRIMDHVNIVKFHEFFEDTNFVHLVLELAPQGSLLNVSKIRGILLEPEVKYYFRQIAAGTRYIHSKDILHRDLKLGNMFLSEHMEIKIGDFGLSTYFGENKPSLCGTPNYVSPEIIERKGHSIASEVWSIGCIVYALLCGKPPFDSGSVDTTYKLIAKCEYALPKHLSTDAVEFLSNILVADPNCRGTLEEPLRDKESRKSLLMLPFISNGFTPSQLPISAVSTPPDFSEKVIDLTNVPCQDEDTKESTGCSPGIGFSLRRMKGFFNSKNDFLEQAVQHLSQLISRSSGSSTDKSLKMIPVYVSKWVDYTNRFGFVYKLSDGSVGVLFNDSTKIGIKNGGEMIEFVDTKGKYHCLSADGNSNYPIWNEIISRVNNLEAFIKYMDDFLHETSIDDDVVEIIATGQKTLIPQLKRWHRTDSCIGMEFNCNLVQINFKEEHIKILLWLYENEMFLTSIHEGKSLTVSLSSEHCRLPTCVQRSILLEIEIKLKELLGSPVRD